MKKMIFGLALIATCVASATTTVTSANTFGVLKVTSSDAETIISVPWLKVGATQESDGITADKIVLTSNLTVGDELYAYSNGSYYKWTLASSESGNYWNDDTTVASSTGWGSEKASDITVMRGTGLILVRNTSTEEPIYLYGQYADLNNVQATTATRSSSKIQTTLIAPPKTGALDLNSISITGAMVGDIIRVDLNTSYTLIDKGSSGYKWCKLVADANGFNMWQYQGENVSITIPAGTGAWYICQQRPKTSSSTANVTINWNTTGSTSVVE